ELPNDLEGLFLRNSSNPRFQPKGRYHWFDGDGMVHGVLFRDGKASYRNRYIRTRGLESELQAGEAVYTGIMEKPDLTRRGGPFKNTANTDLVFHGGKLLALWWLGGKAHRLSAPELETLGSWDFCGTLMRGIASHPKVDPRTGEMMFFDFSMLPPYMTYGVVSPSGEIVHQTPIELPGARLQHDIAITPNYTLVFDMPLFWDPEYLAVGKLKVKFDKSLPSRIGVIPRYGDGATIRWFDCNPFYMYHTINAYEVENEIVLTGCRIENPVPASRENKSRMPRLEILELDPYLTRWRINLFTGLVKEEKLDDVPSEFPRTNDSSLGVQQRFSYNPRIAREEQLLFDAVIKYDTTTGASQTYEYGANKWGGETPFAPRTNARDEDDGYLLTFVYNENDDTSELVIIDAKNVAAGPVARLRIPQRVPIGYHTCWVPAEKLATQRLD
ncbi:MAG TPA: carotenoid oxygenase family protein, partial [Candidatus Hydrogenedentes bacterium]|nr:carotenoid oxygenase family protein [Candidatus Hydrogenedentota bacterium]